MRRLAEVDSTVGQMSGLATRVPRRRGGCAASTAPSASSGPAPPCEELDRIARSASALAAMREVNDARAELFRRIGLDGEAEAA